MSKRQPLNVYFDTNVYEDIRTHLSITSAEVLKIRKSSSKGHISILPSSSNIEEMVHAIKAAPDDGLAKMRLFASMCDWNKQLKPAAMILMDDLRRAIKGKEVRSPFSNTNSLRNICNKLLAYQDTTTIDISSYADELFQQKGDFQNSMQESSKELEQKMDRLLDPDETLKDRIRKEKLPFEQHWPRQVHAFAEGALDRLGLLPEAQARSINKLLKVRSFLLYVGHCVSYTYSLVFDGRVAQPGDSRDQHHAVLASAADVFVTGDKRFAGLMQRIPVPGLQVLKLRDFVETL